MQLSAFIGEEVLLLKLETKCEINLVDGLIGLI
jgi:hypothetical protein